jgi:hypothetical protein
LLPLTGSVEPHGAPVEAAVKQSRQGCSHVAAQVKDLNGGDTTAIMLAELY